MRQEARIMGFAVEQKLPPARINEIKTLVTEVLDEDKPFDQETLEFIMGPELTQKYLKAYEIKPGLTLTGDDKPAEVPHHSRRCLGTCPPSMVGCPSV